MSEAKKFVAVPKVYGAFEMIGPEKAIEYLTHNTKNYRRIKQAVVKRYAKSMQMGRWEKNGEPIIFDEDGNLLDGQHRLSAVVKSGCFVVMFVIRGIGRDVRIFNDNLSRGVKDHACAMGIDLSNAEIAVAGAMVRDFFSLSNGYEKKAALLYGRDHLNEIKLAASVTGKSRDIYKITNRERTLAYLLLRDGYSASEISDFFDVAKSGITKAGRECSPALIIRNMYSNTTGRDAGRDTAENCAYIAEAIDDFIAGKYRAKRYNIQNARLRWSADRVIELWHRIRQLDGID